jgi:hypothetical protein
MLNWLLTLEEAVMLQTVSRFLPELPPFFIDGLEMVGFRKVFRGLDRCGKLVTLSRLPFPHHESSAPRMFPVHRGRSVQHQDIASLGGNVTPRLDAFDLDHMLSCLRWFIFPETTYR